MGLIATTLLLVKTRNPGRHINNLRNQGHTVITRPDAWYRVDSHGVVQMTAPPPRTGDQNLPTLMDVGGSFVNSLSLNIQYGVGLGVSGKGLIVNPAVELVVSETISITVNGVDRGWSTRANLGLRALNNFGLGAGWESYADTGSY